jgi:polysaccharide export outer membrane protein
MNKFVVWLILIVSVCSCVPINKLVYLQNKNPSSNGTQISEVVVKPYRLQINDVLNITIKTDDPKLAAIFSNTNSADVDSNNASLYFSGYTLDNHGKIRFPILGEILAVGYTTDELRSIIEKQLLDDYFKEEANIFVTVRLGGFRYTVNGEVGSRGTKVLYQDSLNILEAIANANDINHTGDKTSVSILRKTPTGIEVHDIDLTDINVMKSPYFNLQPNDYIYVKPLKQKSWGTGLTGTESLTTLFSVFSILTTALLLLKL